MADSSRTFSDKNKNYKNGPVPPKPQTPEINTLILNNPLHPMHQATVARAQKYLSPVDPRIGMNFGTLYQTKQDAPQIQKKEQGTLPVSSPNDREEMEADRVADQVMREEKQPEQIGSTAQEKVMGEGTSGGVLDRETEERVKGLSGKGSPLPDRTRASMEQGFGADFSNVRVHDSSEAADLAQGMNARAFTYGNDIAFNEGEYSPNTESGKRLVAHELAHTVQQGGSVYKEGEELADLPINEYGIYIAKKGETLSHIAEQYNKKYNINISSEELGELNYIRDRMEIQEGDIIMVDSIFLQSDIGRTIPPYIQQIIDRIKTGEFNNTHRHFMYLLNDKLNEDFLISENVTNRFYPEPGKENLYGDIYGENSKWDEYKNTYFNSGKMSEKPAFGLVWGSFWLGVLIEAFEDLYATADLGRKYITWNYDEDIKEINANRDRGFEDLSRDIAEIFFQDNNSLTVAEYFESERAGRRAFIAGEFIGGIKAAFEGLIRLPRLWKRIKNLREIKFLQKLKDLDLKEWLRLAKRSKKEIPVEFEFVFPEFKHADNFLIDYPTEKGIIELSGDVFIDGKTITIYEFSVWPQHKRSIDAGVKTIKYMIENIKDSARRQGFERLIIEGERISGANPHRKIELIFDLR